MARESRETFEDEIRNEFQLERMILFSDAVFAIVITLMAIEIHLPDLSSRPTTHELLHQLKHLAPTVIAYLVSFFFIGTTWYRHLGLFGFLKTYDLGLVVRNLALLFFVGLVPFGASLVSHPAASALPYLLYFAIVILCLIAQLTLQHYILIQRPGLRNEHPITKALIQLRVGKFAVGMFIVAIAAYCITYSLITDPDQKGMAAFCLFPVALIIRLLRNRMMRSAAETKLATEP